jgi:hypothetical protein
LLTNCRRSICAELIAELTERGRRSRHSRALQTLEDVQQQGSSDAEQYLLSA